MRQNNDAVNSIRMMGDYGKDGQQQMKQARIEEVQANARKQKMAQQQRLKQKKVYEQMKKGEKDARLKAKFDEAEADAKNTQQRLEQLEKLESELLDKIKTTANHHQKVVCSLQEANHYTSISVSRRVNSQLNQMKEELNKNDIES